MSLFKKLAKGVAAGAAAGVARSATDNLLNKNRQNQQQQQAPIPQQPMQQPVQQQPPQPTPPAQPSVVEGAFASLLGSAERFMDNASRVLGACHKCNAPVAAGTACQDCGTVAQPLPGQEVNTGPTSCNNCGAPLASSNAVCEYCAI